MNARRVKTPIVESRYGAESARSFGIRSQSRTTMAKIAIAASQCGSCAAASGPSQRTNETEDDERHVDEHVAEQEDVEDAPRVIAKDLDEVLQRRMLVLEAAQLVRLEREERGLQSGEERGAEDENRDDQDEEDETAERHSALRRRLCEHSPSREIHACRFAPHLRRQQTRAWMTKGERISRFVRGTGGHSTDAETTAKLRSIPATAASFAAGTSSAITKRTTCSSISGSRRLPSDADYFKGLIQAAGAFVHLQKQFRTSARIAKHGRRLGPAVRLFRLAEKNLTTFGPRRHGFDVAGLVDLLQRNAEAIVHSDFKRNPWSPESAPRLALAS